MDYSGQTLSRKLYCLKAFFNYLINHNYLEAIPTVLTKKKGYTKTRKKGIFVSSAEIELTVNNMLNKSTEFAYRDAALIAILAETALRTGDIAQLRWSNISDSFMKVTNLTFDLSLRTINLLKQIERVTDFVFVSKYGRPLSRSMVSLILKKSQISSPEKTLFTARDLQFSFIYRQWKNKVSVRDLLKILRHADLKTTWAYIRDFKEIEHEICE